MRPGDSTKIAAAKTATTEAKVRKSLHVLQPAATDKENLVGGGRQLRSSMQVKESLNDETSTKKKPDATKLKKTFKDKSIQTAKGDKIKIEIEDLTSEAGPSENYWQVLAERRRLALEDALEENQQLSQRIVKLEEEKRVYKEMLDESRALIDTLKDIIGEDGNDINDSLDDSVI